MATIMIEGFEQISTSLNLSASQLQYLFLGLEPDEVTGWFSAAGDSVQHTTNGRLGGNCLRFSRGANTGAAWSRKYGANLGFSFVPKQKMCLGWAVRYSASPEQAIPLAMFRFDEGVGDQEQISLWATPDAKLYVSSTIYRADYDLLTIGVNPLAMTPAGVLRFNQWTYIEFVVSYNGTVPSVSVLVNGEIVLDGIESATFQQLGDSPYISSAHIINPTNGHWGEQSFWQEIDDVYLNDSQALGPQWIVGLTNGAVGTNGGWSGVPSDTYTVAGAGVEAADFGDIITWELSDPPVGVGTVNAIGANLIATVPSSIDAFYFGVAGPTDSPRQKGGSVSGGSPHRCFRMVTEVAPSGTTLTGTGLNALRGYLRASEVVA